MQSGMTVDFVETITQGEALHLECRLLDSERNALSVTPATLSAQCASATIEADLSVIDGSSSEIFIVTADEADTASWPKGAYPLQVWADWNATQDPNVEILTTILLIVEETL
jgi:hypothetical protein